MMTPPKPPHPPEHKPPHKKGLKDGEGVSKAILSIVLATAGSIVFAGLLYVLNFPVEIIPSATVPLWAGILTFSYMALERR